MSIQEQSRNGHEITSIIAAVIENLCKENQLQVEKLQDSVKSLLTEWFSTHSHNHTSPRGSHLVQPLSNLLAAQKKFSGSDEGGASAALSPLAGFYINLTECKKA